MAYDPADTGAPPAQWFNKFERSDDWRKTTGRLVVDWEFSDSAMTYFSVATGYKSGGFDGQQFKSFVTGAFEPEEMTSYELGLKGDFLADRIRAEVALFHHELDGRQRSVDTKDSPDDPTAQPTVISSDEEADGIEVILTWGILDTLRLTAMSTYRETKSVSERYFDAAGEPAGGDQGKAESNNDYTLRLDWTPGIPRGFLLLHVDYVFQEDPESYDPDQAIFVNGPWYFQDRKLLSARIAWSDDADRWEVALWGSNLLDKEYASNPGGLAADALGATHTSIVDPLTYGLDLRYAF